MINLNHVYKTYQAERHILRDINLSLTAPDIHMISGLSGAGKTTLFKLFIGQEKPTSGEIEILGKKINGLTSNEFALYRQQIGIVFQDYKLMKDETVFENLALPLKILNTPTSTIGKKIAALADSIGLGAYLDEYPQHLSGGEQQRIAIGRALIHDPKIIFADEPTGNLDPETSQRIFTLFQHAKNNGALVLIVTHDEGLIKQTVGTNFSLRYGELKRAEA